ncbi:MAG: hypothetical protein RL094_700 [Candidatus Parcubacteria bacterium]
MEFTAQRIAWIEVSTIKSYLHKDDERRGPRGTAPFKCFILFRYFAGSPLTPGRRSIQHLQTAECAHRNPRE